MELTKQPLVSVLIPLYNQEKYFGACIRSLQRQTYKNLEIIIVNDGSTDRSPQMAHDWASCDSRVKVIDKTNEGLAYARRDGYLAATGEFVLFFDSDDKMSYRAIEALLNGQKRSGADIVMGLFDNMAGSITTHSKVDSDYPFPFEQVVSQPELFEKYYVNFFRTSSLFPINVWSKFYRKAVIDKAYQETELYSPDVPFMGEDLYFNLKLFPYVNSMYRIDESVLKYRYGGGTFGFNKHMPQVLLLCNKRLEQLDKYNYEPGYQPLFEEYVAFVYNHAAQLIYFNKDDKQGVINFMKQELETRQLMPRLQEFFAHKQDLSPSVKMLLDRDYEAMYERARAMGNETFGTWKYRVIKAIVSFFAWLS